jgi:copper(I)-binding protein
MRHLLVFALLAGSALAAPAYARGSASIGIQHAWIRLLPGDLPAGGYATLTNAGDAAAALVGASSPAYAHVMLHRSTLANGMSTMHMVSKLIVPAHGKVTLAPGGYHLMLMHAKRPLKPGDTVKLRLQFADGSHLDADFLVRPANASP